MPSVDILLKGYDGGHYRNERKGGEFCVTPYLTLNFTFQPEKLKDMASTAAFKGNGLMERFLYFMPVSKVGFRSLENEPVPEALKQFYSDFIIHLLNRMQRLDESEMLRLDAYSQQLFQQFRHEIETCMRPDGNLHAYRGWASKLAGCTLRIAGLLHLTKQYKYNVIDTVTMQQAIHLIRHAIGHAQVVFPYMGFGDVSNVCANAKELWEWMLSKHQLKLRKTAISRGLRQRKLGKADKLPFALRELERRNYIVKRSETTETGSNADFYYINPLAAPQSWHNVMETEYAVMPNYA